MRIIVECKPPDTAEELSDLLARLGQLLPTHSAYSLTLDFRYKRSTINLDDFGAWE